jgi:phage terminase Nu1 subunit (DNA packaging protein)
VALWLAFFAKHNIKGAAEGLPIPASDDEAEDVETGPQTVQEWKAEEIKLKCAKLNLENARVSGTLVYAADVERGVSVLVQSFRQALNNMPDRLAGKIVGITDYHEAVEITQEEVNVILRTLQRCDFLQGFDAAKDAQALPTFEDEREAVEAPVKRKAGRPKGKR